MSRELQMPPIAARRFLERLGPAYVQVGKFLARCPDLIEEGYRDQFLNLRDDSPPIPYELVRSVIAEDLNAPPEELYEWLNPRPVSVGLLAQVHAARSLGGAQISVKIARPGVLD